MDVPTLVAIALASLVAVFALAVIVYAIVQIGRSSDLTGAEKVVWVIGVLCAPLIGALVWYFAGPHPFGLRLTRQLR